MPKCPKMCNFTTFYDFCIECCGVAASNRDHFPFCLPDHDSKSIIATSLLLYTTTEHIEWAVKKNHNSA